MAPPTLFMYDTAGLNAHYARSLIGLRLTKALKPLPDVPRNLDREASERWEEEGGNSARGGRVYVR